MIVYILAPLLVLSGCNSSSKEAEQESTEITGPRVLKVTPEVMERLDLKCEEVKKRPVAVPLHLTGRIEPDVHKEVDVRTRIAGRISDILIAPGEMVKSGQILAYVDSREISDIQSELLEARSKLKIAELHQEREKQIYDELLRRPTTLIKARANFDEAKVQMELYDTEFKRIKGLYEEKIAAAKDFVAAKAKLAQAKTKFKEAEVILEREEHLYKNRAMLKRDYQLAIAESERLKNHVKTLIQRLTFLGCDQPMIDRVMSTSKIEGQIRLVAPIKGVVTYRDVAKGEVVEPSNILFTISDMSTVLLRVDLPEVDLPRVQLGDRVKIRIASYPGEVFEGTISYISVLVNETTRTVATRAKLDNSNGRLKKFMFAEIDLEGAPRQVLACPKDAIQENSGESLAFVKTPEGFEERRVKIGMQGDDYVEVISGLKSGEQVATQGSLMLKNEITFRH